MEVCGLPFVVAFSSLHGGIFSLESFIVRQCTLLSDTIAVVQYNRLHLFSMEKSTLSRWLYDTSAVSVLIF